MPQINLRISEERLALIDSAAARRGVTRTEFVLRSSEAAAVDVFTRNPPIVLDPADYQAFVDALDAPLSSTPEPALTELFNRPAPWSS